MRVSWIIGWICLVVCVTHASHTVHSKHKPYKAHRQRNPGVHRYTVQFRSPINDRQAALADQDAFLNYLGKSGVNVTVRYRFTDIMNGMSIHISPSPRISATSLQSAPADDLNPSIFLAQTLKSCPYVRRYWPGKRYARPRTLKSLLDTAAVVDGGLPNLSAAHLLTGVDSVKKAGWTGKGIKIGILDTGVDYTHPSLGGCFGEGCLVRYGHDLVGDFYSARDGPLPDSDPFEECDGHGTHVAGIIAANDTYKGFQGVAPEVQLGVWRIFGCNGDTDDDIILAAAEMAAQKGMDILNLSLGGGESAWEEVKLIGQGEMVLRVKANTVSQDALAVALSNIEEKGIVVVVAQGNEGKDGIARTPSPAIGRNVLAVASVDNGGKLAHVVRLVNDTTIFGTFEYAIASNVRFSAQEGPAPVVQATGACAPLLQNLKQHVVLVRPGNCGWGQMARHVQNAGGTVMLVAADLTKDTISLRDRTRVRIPVVVISSADGTTIETLLKSERSAVLEFATALVRVKTAGMVSSFSTWGPDSELHVKPDVAAVGGQVYSTYPVKLGSYAMLSGTSMAAPYVSACIALYMHATKQRIPEVVLKAIMNNAKPIVSPNQRDLDSPARQGSGLIQIHHSIDSTTSVGPFKIALNDTANFLRTTSLQIENKANITKVYHLSHVPAAAVSGYDFVRSAVPIAQPEYQAVNGSVSFGHNEFVLQPGETRHVQVVFAQPVSDTPHLLYGGFLVVNETSSQQTNSVHIPYYGSLGNQRDLPIFDTKQGYPYIGNRLAEPVGHKGPLYRSNNSAPVYNFRAGDVLYLYNRMGNPSAIVKYQLVQNNTAVGDLPHGTDHWVSRNDHSNDNSDCVYDWRGRFILRTGQGWSIHFVPNGTFRLRALALKIFGNPQRDDDWEVWYSPEFVVIG